MKYLVFLLFSSSLFAATSGSLILSGIVPVNLSIVFTGQNNYNTLDLSTTQNNLVIGQTTEKSNSKTGYEVYVTSQNAGLLKNGTDDQLLYTAKFNNVGFTLQSTPVKVFDGPGKVQSLQHDVSISYVGKVIEDMVAGTYTDTLTVIIQTK